MMDSRCGELYRRTRCRSAGVPEFENSIRQKRCRTRGSPERIPLGGHPFEVQRHFCGFPLSPACRLHDGKDKFRQHRSADQFVKGGMIAGEMVGTSLKCKTLIGDRKPVHHS